ncbi:Zinc protease PQQL-like [Camellia lanceoleosa]|uniref:Zinc protease PQQL-like n=1 Tax=Camellia lanceoleosa TaxID=1840588 RepID=A0ACC0FI87_9ERIC|nr:Zinc protease PQQL-like [Camellia lanceoleosa]
MDMGDGTGRRKPNKSVEANIIAGASGRERHWQGEIEQVLRFKHGQIYSAGISVFLGGNKPSRVDNVRGDISVNFSCDPDISTTLEEGPTDEDVLTILEIEQRAHENGLQENYYWLDRILRSYQSRIYFGDVGTSFEGYSSAQRQTVIVEMQSTLKKKAPNAIKEIRKFAQKAMGTKDVRVDVNTSGAEASEVSQGGLEFALLAREMMMKMQKKSSTLLLLLLKSHWKG